MQTHAYPDFLAHKSEHDHLTERVMDLQRGFRSNEVRLTIEAMEFLKDWLRHHILGSDKKYSPFLNTKGVHYSGVTLLFGGDVDSVPPNPT